MRYRIVLANSTQSADEVLRSIIHIIHTRINPELENNCTINLIASQCHLTSFWLFQFVSLRTKFAD